MKIKNPILLFIVFVLTFGGISTTTQPVQSESSTPDTHFTDLPLCLPDVYLVPPADCLLLGPSQKLTDLAKSSGGNPLKPLRPIHPAAKFQDSPVKIAKINGDPLEPVKIYASLDGAAAGINPVSTIPAGRGLHYVSYTAEAKVEGNSYVQLKSGGWVRASPSGFSTFQGVLFKETPSAAFGWVIDTIKGYSAPSFSAPEIGETINRETFIQIFEVVEAEGMEWYRIDDYRWVPYLKARRARVDPTPPAGVTGDRWVSVDLFDQVAMVYENRQLVFATLVSTGGEPYYTRPGLFQIKEKKPLETMTGAFEAGKLDFYYLEDVLWTMYFDQARALHGAYWRPWFGVAGTHGCVNFSLGDANWLYQWAKKGDWVYVWDPSGKTPTDPAFYGAGGA
jgi:hypothetical protein